MAVCHQASVSPAKVCEPQHRPWSQHGDLQSQVDPMHPSLSPAALQPPEQGLPVFLLEHPQG